MAWSDAARAAAAEARRRNPRTLYHGTTSKVTKVLARSDVGGRKGVWLTSSKSDAKRWAKEAVARSGGRTTIFSVMATKQKNLRLMGATKNLRLYTTTSALKDAVRLK